MGSGAPSPSDVTGTSARPARIVVVPCGVVIVNAVVVAISWRTTGTRWKYPLSPAGSTPIDASCDAIHSAARRSPGVPASRPWNESSEYAVSSVRSRSVLTSAGSPDVDDDDDDDGAAVGSAAVPADAHPSAPAMRNVTRAARGWIRDDMR